MSNLICSILGHKRLIKDWYPHDKITTVQCMRCDKIIDRYNNPTYNPNWIPPVPPWFPAAIWREHRAIFQQLQRHNVEKRWQKVPILESVQKFTIEDPYGEEVWED